MKRAVITGIGIKSPIGQDKESVIDSLRYDLSGIRFVEDFAERELNSHIAGQVDFIDWHTIPKAVKRFMGKGSAMTYVAMNDAIIDANLSKELVSNERTGCVVGSAASSMINMRKIFDSFESRGIKRVKPGQCISIISNAYSAILSVAYEIKGVSYTISSACATGLHCIGHARELIQMGKQDIVFAGGGDECDWTINLICDGNFGALSTKYNDRPKEASRPWDKGRDGYIIGEGAGIVVIEEYEHAKARNARIYGEIIGYNATSDGYSMAAPDGDGAERCMNGAIQDATHSLGEFPLDKIDYINAHATSTPIGDPSEAKAIQRVWSHSDLPLIQSTKSLTGHGLGSAGVQELIYSILQSRRSFLAKTSNLNNIDDDIKDIPFVTELIHDFKSNIFMTNSFGFGGTNATMLINTTYDND